MRLLLMLFAIAMGCVGCATMTADQCRNYVAVARLAVSECDRISDADDAASCRAAAQAALLVAETECGRIEDE
jgi:hypothetical protein